MHNTYIVTHSQKQAREYSGASLANSFVLLCITLPFSPASSPPSGVLSAQGL